MVATARHDRKVSQVSMLEIRCWLMICHVCGTDSGTPTEGRDAAGRHAEQAGWLRGASGDLCPWCVCRLAAAAIQTATSEPGLLEAAA